ncbi:DUF4190 domain-containing protein [Brevundimonas sp.]|jgi:hypothetical protein|uniref:DUF4190 domain-containing protein n=1 Tax=Brevundimonas sp. TaxID=1871086 RepID=UPI002ED9CC7A
MSDNDYQAGMVPANPTNGLAIASLVLGILSVLFVWIPVIGMVSWILAPIGLVLGLVALGKPGGKGLAIAGSICSGVGLLGCIGWVFLFGAAMMSSAGSY